MPGRDTLEDLRRILVRENVRASAIDKIEALYLSCIRDEDFQKQHVKISEENYTIYIQQIIDAFKNNKFTNETAQSYIKFVFEKIYRGSLK